MRASNVVQFIRTVRTWCDVYGAPKDRMEGLARDVWWPKLERYEFEDVQLAMDHAHTHNRKGKNPNWMFNLAQVENALAAIMRKKAEEERAAAAAPPPQDEGGNQDGRRYHPLTDQQREWVAAAATPLKRLARQWEVEEQNRVRGMTTSEGVERAAALRVALDEMGGIG